MPLRLRADGDNHTPSIPDVLSRLFDHAQLNRIELVVREVNRQQRRYDVLQFPIA